MTGNYEYSCSNKENLHLTIQMKVSKKPYTSCVILLKLLEFTSNFQCSGKKNHPPQSSISEVIDSERCAYLNA